MVAVLHDLVSEGYIAISGGKWSLTPEGVAAAVDLRTTFSTRNVTDLWITCRVDAAYLTRLTSALGQWCPRSAQFGELEDLVQHYLTNVVRRDGFRKRILQCRPPAFSDVKQWVYNAALSLWRDEGRDAQTRAFKGARTEKDLLQKNDDDVASRSVAADTQAIFLVVDGEGDTGSMSSSGVLPMPLIDVHGGDFQEEMMHHLSWMRGIERASAVIRQVKQGAPDRFERLLHDVAVGDASYREIGKTEGVSRNRAATLVNDLRTVLHRERDLANLAVRVFAYLKENPYSTVADMEAPEDEDVDATEGGLGVTIPRTLLDGLVVAGRIARKGTGARECFTLTAAGESALFDGDYFGVDLNIHRPSRSSGSADSSRV